jgi:hypothetical protein
MNENLFALVFAACALVVGTAGPLLSQVFIRRVVIKDREEERERQDAQAKEAREQRAKLLRRQNEIAETAAAAAELIREQQQLIVAKAAEAAVQTQVVADQLLESNKTIAATAANAQAGTTASLTAIHTLVNSNLTQAQNRELDATRAMLAAMREVITLKEARGAEISPTTVAAIETVEKRIAVLSHDLSHREVVTAVVDQVLKEQKNADRLDEE